MVASYPCNVVLVVLAVVAVAIAAPCSVAGNPSDEFATKLAAAILEDMMPESSANCVPPANEAHSTLEFPTDAASDHSDSWRSDYVPLEASMFQGLVGHHDAANSNRSWELRVAASGTMYSFRGAYGETVPPQEHDDAPWIDEVWQQVAVDGVQNNPGAGESYFIHQAGTYTREAGMAERPFFSPSVAAHCAVNGSCAFASWGQQAHIPTDFTSRALYFTRFRDCGRGVAEVVWMVHHFGVPGQPGGDDVWTYHNVPWGGYRPSVFKSYTLARKADGVAGNHAC